MRVPVQGPLAPPMSAELDLPANGTVQYRTTARVPDGGAVILSGVAKALPNVQSADHEVLLILTPTIIND